MRPSIEHLVVGVVATTFLLHCCQHLFISARILNHEQIDKQALLDIKAKISSDPLGVLASWNETTALHHCRWEGVKCGQRHPRVTRLDLSSSKLAGILSPFLGNLSFLKGLFLYGNNFRGVIPTELGRLNKLQALNLSKNSINGEIPPSISSCASLTAFAVMGNKLVGEIPSWLGSLSNLQNLMLAKNNLTGRIPLSLGNLSSLINLDLELNNLVGNIPHNLGNLLNLKTLALTCNNLSGEVPPSIYNLSNLEIIDLGGNLLEGKLPSRFHPKVISNLQFFSVAANHFSGPIPDVFSNFSNLETLELCINNLQGQVPSLNRLHKLTIIKLNRNFLGNDHPADLNFISYLANATTKLRILDLPDNNFGGTIPISVCNFSMLNYIGMEYNKLVGHIPTCLQYLTQLQTIYLSSNRLIGSIPPEMGKLHQLYLLDLVKNKLSGNIPFSLGNLTNLGVLMLSANNLQGHIPFTLGNCKKLQVIFISDNFLSGSIPPQILNLSSLSDVLDLSNNYLTGSLPLEVGQLTNLANLDISNNLLSGQIPSTIGNCIELVLLYMEQNHFQGCIPQALASLRGLSDLDLSSNNLSGNIPKYLATFQLLRLNLSYNNFEGEVPIGGVFNNASGISLHGNHRLCGEISDLHLPKCNSNKAQKGKLHHIMRLVIITVSGLLGIIIFLAFFTLYVFFYRKRSNKPTNEFENPYSYQSLVRATNGFSSKYVIGSGTFGVVYKGILDQDQTIVAIKRFNLEHKGASKSFVAECGALRNIRHRNLVKVITACSSVDCEGNDFKALIFEYTVNGSLEHWLHPCQITSPNRGNNPPRSRFNVHQRLGIAIDVAFALEYLHHRCGSPIVHCDLKPSNVLLDDEMVAHVGDFGLAKFLMKDISNSQGFSSIGIRGTIGYAPPEYGLGNEVSTQGDVYSFGILLLEMFTGKRPTNDLFKDGLGLHKFVKTTLPERVSEIIDDVLVEELADDDNVETSFAPNTSRTINNNIKISEAVIAVLEVGLSCSAELPQERPDMSSVAAKLSSIKKFVGNFQVLNQAMYDEKVFQETEE